MFGPDHKSPVLDLSSIAINAIQSEESVLGALGHRVLTENDSTSWKDPVNRVSGFPRNGSLL